MSEKISALVDGELDHAQALTGIEAVEGLVEHDDLRIVHDCSGDLDALAHALRVRAQGSAVCGIELDEVDRGTRCILRLVQPGELRHGRDELQRRDRFEHALLLRDEPDLAIQGLVTARGAAEDGDLAL